MPLTEVTDPNELESIRAAFSGKAVGQGAPSGGLKEVTDPSVLASVKSQFEPKPAPQQKTELLPTAEEESWMPEALKPLSKGYNLAREILTGEVIAKAPTLLAGESPRTGAQTSRELETERRGMIPEYRKYQGGFSSALQAAANTAADAIAMVGTEVSLPIELATVAGRHLGQAVGGLATDIPVAAYRAGYEEPAKALFGDLSARILAKKQQQGEYATATAAKETAKGLGEFAKGAAFGIAPAVYEPARVFAEGVMQDLGQQDAQGVSNPSLAKAIQNSYEGSDLANASMEAIKAYPLASILPFWHGAKYAGERKGSPIVREGQPVQTITGKPVVANKFGEAMFEPVQAAERVAQGAAELGQKVAAAPAVQKVAGVAQKAGAATGKAGTATLDYIEKQLGPEVGTKFGEARTTASELVKDIKPIVGDTVKDVVEWGKRDVQPMWQRLAFDAVTPKDVASQVGITRANEIMMGGESPAAKKMRVAVSNFNVLRDLQTELADPRFKAATPIEKFQAIEGTLGDTTKTTEVPVMDQASRASAQELGELFVQHGMPLDVAQKAVPYTILEGVRLAQQGKITDPTSTLATAISSLKNMSPADAAARVKAYGTIITANMKDPNFIAAADRAWSGKGYRWVPGAEVRQRNGYAEAIREVQKEAAARGKPLFELHTPELGELRKDYTYSLYNNLIDDLDSTPVGRKQLMQLLMSSPIARMAANPTSPTHIQALAAWHSQPGGARARLAERLNELSVEMVQNYGLSPATVLKHHDRWLSRAFTDAIDGQINLSNYIDKMSAEARMVGKIQRQVDSSRYARKLGQTTSNERFMDMVTKGDISLHDALASTVTASMVMANHLFVTSEIHDMLKAQGLLFDKQRPGTVKTPEVHAAPTKEAASPDPYNYAYGKLAGKWVDKTVANQLGLVPYAMRQAVETMPAIRALNDLGKELLGMNRFLHTTGNAIVYPIRNAVTDPLVVMAASGESPYRGQGRRLNLEAKADVDRLSRTSGDPAGMIVSPDLRELFETGLSHPNKIPNDSAIPSNLRSKVQSMGGKMEKMIEQASDPAARVKALAHAAMYAKAMGMAGTIEMPLAALQAAKEASNFRKQSLAAGEGSEITIARMPSEYIGALNDQFSEMALSKIMSKMEMQRVLWSYKVARHVLKLDKDRAAIFVRDAMYGTERPSELVSKITQNPWAVMTVLPLFANYGIWQPKRSVQRALNDKHLWTNYMIMKGLDAMNEDDLLREPFMETNHRDRLARMHVQHSAASEIGLGTVDGVQSFMRAAGVPEAVVQSVGKPNNIISQDLTNLIGGQTFMHQYRPDKEGLAAATQFGVYGGLINQMMDNRLQDSQMRDQTGLRPGEVKGVNAALVREVLKSLVYHTFPGSWTTPIRPEDPSSMPIPIPFIGRAAGAVEKMGRAKIEGKPAYKNVYKEEVNPVDLMSREFGSFAPNIIDSASFQARLARNLGFQARKLQETARDQLKYIPPGLPQEEQKSLQEQINLDVGERLGQLQRAYTWQETETSLDAARRKSREAAQKYYERMKKAKGEQ